MVSSVLDWEKAGADKRAGANIVLAINAKNICFIIAVFGEVGGGKRLKHLCVCQAANSRSFTASVDVYI
jgi:hypothetical protein